MSPRQSTYVIGNLSRVTEKTANQFCTVIDVHCIVLFTDVGQLHRTRMLVVLEK